MRCRAARPHACQQHRIAAVCITRPGTSIQQARLTVPDANYSCSTSRLRRGSTGPCHHGMLLSICMLHAIEQALCAASQSRQPERQHKLARVRSGKHDQQKTRGACPSSAAGPALDRHSSLPADSHLPQLQPCSLRLELLHLALLLSQREPDSACTPALDLKFSGFKDRLNP